MTPFQTSEPNGRASRSDLEFYLNAQPGKSGPNCRTARPEAEAQVSTIAVILVAAGLVGVWPGTDLCYFEMWPVIALARAA